MDFRLDSPATFLLTGPSQVGKTTTLESILEFAPEMFKDSSFLQYVVIFHKEDSAQYKRIESKLSKMPQVKKIEFINECPTGPDIKGKIKPWAYSGGSTVIIDDFGSDIDKSVADYFTSHSHHCNSVGFLLTQDLFPREHHHRLINRNCKHILVFPSHRDKNQFFCFAGQFAPNSSSYLKKAYLHLSETSPRSYIWFDCRPAIHPILRVKSNFIPSEWPIRLITPYNSKYEI